MDNVYDLDTIYMKLDDYLKRKPISRCRDELLNILYGENEDDDVVDCAQA